MYKIKTLNNIASCGVDCLTQVGCTVECSLERPDGILVRSAKMHDLEFNSELLAIARAGAGTNNIPIERCTAEGIVVFNTPGANSEAVKELVICSLMLASRDIIGGVEWVRSIAGCGSDIPAMVEKGKASFSGPEIVGKTLGVVGLGAIGAKIANTAIALGMEVYGFDPYLSVDAAWQLSKDVRRAINIEDIYRNCDYITLHVPYTEATHHMINAESISTMRDGVRIINIARGELVCDEDMLAALDVAKVARYITDFPNELTAGVPNIVPMPHLGASTPESEEKCAIMAANQLFDYLENGNISNSVNMPTVELERIGVSRICVIHMNVPRVINHTLELIGDQNINVEHMINKQRGDIAYTIIDTGSKLDECTAEKIRNIKDVIRVRLL